MSATPERATNVNSALLKQKVEAQNDLLSTPQARRWLMKHQLKRGNGSPDGRHYELQASSYTGQRPGTMVKADGYVRTVNDMAALHYGYQPMVYQKQFAKDDPVLSTTTGVANAIYGQEVYSLLNSESNIYGLLESRPWRKSGERAVTGRGHSLGSGGVGENASLPATEKPNLTTFEQTPKTIAHTFDVSMIEELLAGTDDDHFADSPMEWLRQWFGTGTEHQNGQGEHPKHINVQLAEDTDQGLASTDNMESIDRAISDGSESSLLNAAGDNDIYGFDRSSNEFESNVIHNSGTNENFTLDHCDEALTAVREASGKEPTDDPNYFWLTGHDTFEIWEQEVGGKERLEPTRVKTGVNGVETVPGDDVGITVQSYKDIPIFRSNDITTDGISRIYLIDSSTLWIKELLPTTYYSTGVNEDNNPWSIDRLGNEGMFVTVGELTMTQPNAHVKVRDLT